MASAQCVDCGVAFDSKAWNDLWCGPCGERVRIQGEMARAEVAKVWEAAGFSSDEAQRLADSGFLEVDDIKPWTDAGFNVGEAILWSEYVFADWDNPGHYEIGDHTNLTLAEVASWKAAGFLPRQVEAWMDHFLNPFEAGEWQKRGVGAHEAAELHAAGRSPETVKQERDAQRRRERGPSRLEVPDTFAFVAERCSVALGGSPMDSMWIGSGPDFRR